MKPLTHEWVAKAEGDFYLAVNAMKSRSRHVPDGVCFHSQQCVEKHLKARLVEAGVAPPRSHDLPELLKLLLPIEPLWSAWRSALGALTFYAVPFRYPGQNATRADARQALRHCRSIRKEVRLSLGLPA